MKTTNISPRVQNAIDIYLDALNKGTLAKGSCAACAVGNLTAAAMGATLERVTEAPDPILRAILSSPVRNLIVDEEAAKEIEAEMGKTQSIRTNTHNGIWKVLFFTDESGVQNVDQGAHKTLCICGQCNTEKENKRKMEEAERVIALTDFSKQELMQIEHTFETNTKINLKDYHKHSPEEIRADQIQGLNAVVALMLSFEESEERVQDVFTSKAELIAVC